MKIVLDAGHYSGYNRSNVLPAYAEGNMTWNLYVQLKKSLEKYGHKVTGTRSDRAKDLMVYDRGQKAKGTDLFISLHSNACDNASVQRVVVITPYIDKDQCYQLANQIGAKVSSTMGITEKYQIYTRTYVDNAGKTRDYYGVIRGAVDAGCRRSLIIEHGFHTNKKIALWLYQETNLKMLADAEAKVIDDFFKENGNAKKGYEVGDTYVVKKDDYYSNGNPASAWTIGKEFTVKRIMPGRILLDEINSWIIVKE